MRFVIAGWCLVAACLCGCSSTDNDRSAVTPSTVKVLDGALAGSTVPVDQQAALIDGTVDAGEYAAAFERFRACVEAGGGTVIESSRDLATGVITYGVGADSGHLGTPGLVGTGIAGDCYERDFAYIEQSFMSSDAVVASQDAMQLKTFDQEYRPCLEANNVPVPADLRVGSDQWNDLYEQFLELGRQGKCPGITIEG